MHHASFVSYTHFSHPYFRVTISSPPKMPTFLVISKTFIHKIQFCCLCSLPHPIPPSSAIRPLQSRARNCVGECGQCGHMIFGWIWHDSLSHFPEDAQHIIAQKCWQLPSIHSLGGGAWEDVNWLPPNLLLLLLLIFQFSIKLKIQFHAHQSSLIQLHQSQPHNNPNLTQRVVVVPKPGEGGGLIHISSKFLNKAWIIPENPRKKIREKLRHKADRELPKTQNCILHRHRGRPCPEFSG